MAFSGVGGVAGIAGIAAALGPVGGALLAIAAAAGVLYAAYKWLPHGNDGAPKKPVMLTPAQLKKGDGTHYLSHLSLNTLDYLHGVKMPKPDSHVISDWFKSKFESVAPAKSAGAKSGDVYIDGKKVGVVVAPHVTNSQAKSAMRPQAGSTRHDGNMSLSPVGSH